METEVVKTVAGLFNAAGGTLLIGVKDGSKEVVGLERDFATLGKRRDADGFEQFLRSLLSHAIGTENSLHVRIGFAGVNEVTACVLQVPRAARPVFVDDDILYVRDGNTTRRLTGQELLTYAREHFSG